MEASVVAGNTANESVTITLRMDPRMLARVKGKNSIKQKAGNSAILKVNQAGSLGDAMDFANLCNQNNYGIITSHRSGDTVDNHLAHIAIGSGAVMIKSGVVGGERIAKLNELIRIDETNFINNDMSLPIARINKYVN